MEACLEDSLESEIMSCNQGLWSAKNEGDSNAFILPKRKKQKKVNQLLKAQKNKKLSKSQIKMQHKLEEDKKKSLLWQKSMEDIEKYKIQDDVYSLMWSSSKIGQVETVRDRRRREVQFSNAGIALPQNDHPLKTGVNPRCETETAIISEESAEIESLPQVICDVPAFPESSKQLVDRSGLCITAGEAVTMRTEKEVAQEFPHSTCKFEKTPKDTEIEKPKDHTSTGNLVKCTMSRVAAAPLVVHVTRPKGVEISRKDLPIVMMEQEIMEAINENSSVIICGETGCGKTTQVPQFLYEAGYGSAESTDRRGIIGVTQPRRVAVLATARRVAYELGQKLGKGVGFQVKHDKMFGNSCSIKFMTDGILLREVQNDFLLSKYSVLILDEAHERSLNTDILIGMLSRSIQQRQVEYEKQLLLGDRISPEKKIYPLKLILMSATLRVEDFISGNRIFRAPPPVIKVPTRQYEVPYLFSKLNEEADYIGEAYKKVMTIHKKMRPGGILVFVTGAREVEFLCRQLRKASDDLVEINSRRNTKQESSSVPAENLSEQLDMEMMNEAFRINSDSIGSQTDRFSSYDDENDGDFFSDNYNFPHDLESSDSELEGIDEEFMVLDGNISESFVEDVNLSSLKAAFEALSGKTSTRAEPDENKAVPSIRKQSSNQFAGPMCVLPLYAMLHPREQLRVFENTKEGERLVVVATNVAETSLTIPGIKYVVDTGREKVKKYNSSNGIESFEIQFISKASAEQRRGRAGRTGPGLCFRLYPSAKFVKLDDFSKAQILKVPVDDMVLRLKSMGIEKVHNFPFPTPPEHASLAEAERCLKALEALDMKGKLTPLGKAMSHYPLSPRHSRMLLTVIKLLRNTSKYQRSNFVLGYAVATTSALSLSNPFVTRFDEVSKNANDKSRKKKIKEAFRSSRAKFSNPSSDALSVAYALQCFELSENPNVFCDEYMLHYKTMDEMSKLRKQLLQLVFKESEKGDQPEFVWAHGTIEDVECAWKDFTEKSRLRSNEEDILCQAICAGWADRVAKRTKKAPVSEGEMRINATRYEACVVKEPVFLNKRSSVSKFAPEFLVYSELIYSKRPYIHGATSVKPEWLVEYAGSLCNFKPRTDAKRYYDELKDQVFCWVDPTFGPNLWQLPSHRIPIKNASDRADAFAFCLLDGQILPSLKPDLKKFMKGPPSSILRSEGLGQRRVENLLNKLKNPKIIDSCAKLRELWDESPKELYEEIREWFQKGFRDQFDDLWSKMQEEVKMDRRERYPKRAKRARS